MSDLTITNAGISKSISSGGKKAGKLVKITPTDLSGVAYAADDIIFKKAELKNAVRIQGGTSVIRNITMFVEGADSGDDLILLFFDNDTALGEPIGDPMASVTADAFRAAGCIGYLMLNGGLSAIEVSAGMLYMNHYDYLGEHILAQASADSTSLWVACFQQAGTLDLVDTDSLSLTVHFEYLD